MRCRRSSLVIGCAWVFSDCNPAIEGGGVCTVSACRRRCASEIPGPTPIAAETPANRKNSRRVDMKASEGELDFVSQRVLSAGNGVQEVCHQPSAAAIHGDEMRSAAKQLKRLARP